MPALRIACTSARCSARQADHEMQRLRSAVAPSQDGSKAGCSHTRAVLVEALGEVADERRAPARRVPPCTERMTTRCAERAAATAWRIAARRSSELATAETSSRTVLTPIDASTLRVVPHAGELLGVDRALRARSSAPGAITAPRTMKRWPSGSWMLAPRTVNERVRSGREHRRRTRRPAARRVPARLQEEASSSCVSR